MFPSNEPLRRLERAIGDTGWFRWWTHDLPGHVQFEFAWVHLYQQPEKESEPPSNVVAIRFVEPSLVQFLTRPGLGTRPTDDWPEVMRSDQLEPIALDPDEFTLTDPEGANGMVSESSGVDTLIDRPLEGIPAVTMAFWAQQTGVVCRARAMEVLTFAGPISIDDIPRLNDEWWEYWRRYWQRADSDAPLPIDPTCEAVIPAEP